MITRLSQWYFSKKALPYWCIFILDCLLILVSGLMVYGWNYSELEMLQNIGPLSGTLAVYLLCYVAMFRVFHTYTGIVRYSSVVDIQRIGRAMLSGLLLALIMKYVFADRYLLEVSLFDLVVVTALSTTMMGAVRMLVRELYDVTVSPKEGEGVFVYGVKEGGLSIAQSLTGKQHSPYVLRAFVSDVSDMVGHQLMGKPVYLNDEHLIGYMRKHQVGTLLVSPLKNDAIRENSDMVDRLIKAGIRICMLPSIQEWDGKSALDHTMLKKVEIEDLLPREKIEVDLDAVGRQLKGACILITGAAGSIGSEMVRQIAKFAPSRLVLIDQAETPMHDVRLYMSKNHPDIETHTIVTTICNATRMEEVFRDYRPAYVLHAAAYKHVPMMEDNPSEAVQNNIYGTRVLADLAVKYETQKFVMISTDKAVNPTNVMGCSKRICEIYVQSLDRAIKAGQVKGVTQFVTTRFGNVLGSNGSVIPIFRRQIEAGGPITVTHPDIIRYFMLIPEACKLVLEAGTMGKGGEIFIFDMGNPVRIADLAKRMIQLSGAKNVEIVYSGLRDGEKLYEELLNDQEITIPTHHPKIKVAQVREYEYEYEEARRHEMELYDLSFGYDAMAVVRKMKEIVPEFKSQHSVYEVLDH